MTANDDDRPPSLEPVLPTDRFDLLFEDAAIGMAIEGLDGRFVAVNPALCRLVGYSREQLLTMAYMDICHPEDLEGEEHLINLSNGLIRTYVRELRYIRSDQAVIWVRVHIGVSREATGRVTHYAVQIEDITDRHLAEQRFRRAFDDAAVGMALIELTERDDTIVEANAMTGAFLGRRVSELVGTSMSSYVHGDDAAALDRLFGDLASGARRQSEASVRFVARDGTEVWAHLSASAPGQPGERSAFFVLHLQDITARRVAEARLAHQADHDALTGLPNRHALTRQLESMSAPAPTGKPDCRALLFIDLDRFKLVNDSLGHTVGDELLIAVAGRLRGGVADGDLVARIGGDEFVVLARSTATIGAAERLAARLLSAIEAPFHVAGRRLYMTASVGIALADPGVSPDELLPAADLAMHGAKGAGKARTAVFDSSMRRQADHRLATEQGLYHAIEQGELVLWYQSIISVESRLPVAAEALIRWQHPQAGLLQPADFLPVAEETGLAVPIGRYVLCQALDQVRTWRDQDLALVVHVNLAGAQLVTPGLVTDVKWMLAERNLMASDLCVEVSEKVLADPGHRAAGTLTELRRLGVSVAIDDFGLGASSLASLRRYRVDGVKIDGSFVSTLDGNRRDAAIMGGLLGLIHSLGMTCTAEAVETAVELEQLAELGCDQVQGYLTGRAQPAEEWLAGILERDAERALLPGT